MNLYEYVGNLHMHTPYSDGEAHHNAIARAAIRAGLDFIIVTDHNVLVRGVEGYYTDSAGKRPTLLLTGEEVHDQTRLPQVNHCLVYGVPSEVAQHAANPQALIDTVNAQDGLTFLAHPADHSIEWVHESAIPWVDWDVHGYAGIEIWNYMSNFKTYLDTPLHALRNGLRPRRTVLGPHPDSLELWDRLLLEATSTGSRVIGIGNSDAHGTIFRAGPLHKVIYPYDFLFTCVNTHLLTTQPLTGHIEEDRFQLFRALREGRCFVGYGIPADPRGFRFSGQGNLGSVPMGGALKIGTGVTLQAHTPRRAHLKLIHRGRVIEEKPDHDTLTFAAHEPGTYRIEAWLPYDSVERCWILSNPIYLR